MTYRKGKFFVHLIVNFNEIQHYTWLGTFWNFVYKYTYTCKFTKNFFIHCVKPAFFLLIRCYPWLSTRSFLLYCHYYCTAPSYLQSGLFFHLKISYFFQFLAGNLLDFCQSVLCLPDFLPIFTWFLPDYLESTRFLFRYFLDFYQITWVYQITYRIFA